MERKITVIPASPRNEAIRDRSTQKLRVAAYCRVSTDHEEQLDSFSNQVEYYTNYINQRQDYVLAGMFTDEGISGTGTKKRSGFMEMIRACDEGRVDMVVTKSISRFARNTADCLHYSRHLKEKGIPVFFEKENINTMDTSGELLFTILSSLAQEESRNISENTAWGIRSRFQKGIPHLNTNRMMGYDKDEQGNLVINVEQAEVVRRIFREFLEGWSTDEIARKLNKEGIPGVCGAGKWTSNTIKRMLGNEKHAGDLLMQKTYTSDYLKKTQKENNGELERYFVRDNHQGIISRDDWEAAQLEMERRKAFRARHSIVKTGSRNLNRFYSKVFCGHCQGKFVRRNYPGLQTPYWKCENTEKKKGHLCSAERVTEEGLQRAVVAAWNTLTDEREQYLPKWEKMVEKGNALERYRAKMLIAVTADGPLEIEVPELTRMFLEEITVMSATEMTVRFLDGTEIMVRI